MKDEKGKGVERLVYCRLFKNAHPAMGGIEILRSEAYLDLRRNDDG
jgi:hypothetical protein